MLFGAAAWDRTKDLKLRSLSLYPTELQLHFVEVLITTYVIKSLPPFFVKCFSKLQLTTFFYKVKPIISDYSVRIKIY